MFLVAPVYHRCIVECDESIFSHPFPILSFCLLNTTGVCRLLLFFFNSSVAPPTGSNVDGQKYSSGQRGLRI